MAFLSFKNLIIGYKSLHLIEDINLKLESGEVYCLVGINGAGKSSLLKRVVNLIPKISGEIFLNIDNINLDLSTLSNLDRARYVSLSLTGFPQLGHFTVYEVIALGRSMWTNRFSNLTAEDKSAINEAVCFFDLSDLLQKEFSKLSDGQKQKVLLAKVFAQDSKLILLDEPTSYLDYKTKDIFFKKIVNYAKNKDKIILISTHDILFAKTYIDKYCIIDKKSLLLYDLKKEGEACLQIFGLCH